MAVLTHSISIDCPHCQAFQTVVLKESPEKLEFPCGACGKAIILANPAQTPLSSCPLCCCKDFHQHKDFNKKIGLFVFLLGAVFVPWTYAISLLVALALDAAFYPFFPWMIVCYRCKSEFRGWPKSPDLDRFNHEIAARYEYGKEQWPSTPS